MENIFGQSLIMYCFASCNYMKGKIFNSLENATHFLCIGRFVNRTLTIHSFYFVLATGRRWKSHTRTMWMKKHFIVKCAEQYNMTHILHIISLHNLPVSGDICRNVALTIRFPDDRKLLLGPERIFTTPVKFLRCSLCDFQEGCIPSASPSLVGSQLLVFLAFQHR